MLGVLHRYPRYDLVFESVDFHLAIVGVIAAFAFLVAIAAAAAVQRTRQGALIILAVACLAVGAFMLAHGLTTPGIFGRPVNQWVGRFPVLAIGLFAASLSIAATRPDGRLLTSLTKRPRAVLLTAGITFATVAVIAVIWPAAGIGSRPLPAETLLRTWILLLAAVALLVAGAVHWWRYRLSSERMQLALVVASWQGSGAALSLELGQQWHLAWWDYHVFLLIGFAAAVYAVAIGSRRRERMQQVWDTVFVSDPLEHIEQGYSDALRVLVGAVEARDGYTAGHSARVAELSVRIGQRLALRSTQLRTLAEGAYLHDVGKIGVPDGVLNKPGRLDEDEWAWIREHPVVGVEIAGRAPSLHGALDMIRHHHERFDGTGYPDRLADHGIPLLARIVAVADVWDALTSERAYRAAWQPDRALAHLVAARGTHFDPECLDAFTSIIGEQQDLLVERSSAWRDQRPLATACHDHPPTPAR